MTINTLFTRLRIPRPIARWGRAVTTGGALAVWVLAVPPNVTPVAAQAGGQEAVLRGTVHAQGTGPLEGVSVTWEPEGRTTSTGTAGRFELNVPEGRAGTLTFEHPTHFSEERSTPALGPGEVRSYAVTLSPVYAVDALEVVAPRQRPC